LLQPAFASGSVMSVVWPQDLPPCFFLLLSPVDRQPRGRVALLHGWNQNHQCWLHTAVILRDKLNLEVLLLDFYNHGHSPTLDERHLHCVETLCRQFRALVLHVGWGSSRFAIGAASMGGSVALHYFLHWPGSVTKLVLVGSAGLEEAAWIPSSWAGRLIEAALGMPPEIDIAQDQGKVESDSQQLQRGSGRSLADVSTDNGFVSRFLARLSYVTTTPAYRVPAEVLTKLRDWRVGITVASAGLDILHRPHHAEWKTVPGTRILHHPWYDHATLCVSISKLKLWEDPTMWIDDVSKL